MADSKISALPSASTPLAGTEVLPIVKSGVTDQVSVANLTAGRAVTGTSFKATSSVGVGTDPGVGLYAVGDYPIGYTKVKRTGVNGDSAASVAAFVTDAKTVGDAIVIAIQGHDSANNEQTYTALVARIVDPTSGSEDSSFTITIQVGGSANNMLTLSAAGVGTVGNFVPTATRGIDYSANTPAAGMTSQLLNWYEEGTWTPNQGAGLTVVGAFSSSGTYTRIGRQVTVRGQVVGVTSVAITAAGVMSSNLPYAASVSHAGSMFNSAVNTSGVVQITSSSVVAATTIAATPNITFTATYTV